MTRHYAILGTGALGGFYGARLQRVGIPCHFLAHRDAGWIRQHGLKIESKDGDFHLERVTVYDQAALMPACDVVLVALKATQNHALANLLPPVTKPDGVVVMMQNGLGGDEAVAAIVGPQRVMGGLCFLCSHKVGPGQVRHLDYGYIELAEFSADGSPRGVTDRMRMVAGDFEQAGICVELSDDLLLARWKKLVWNIPYNGLSVILDAHTDALMSDPDTRGLIGVIMREVAADARACGKDIPASHIQRMLDNTMRMKPYATSMKLDYDQGRPMEIESIFGNPWRAAVRAGVESPHVRLLYELLRYLDRCNDKSR